MDDELRNRLEQRRNFLKRIIDKKQEALDKYPVGRLRISTSHGRTQYYCRTDPKDWSGRYIEKNNHILAYQLAQKDYDNKVFKAAEEELLKIEALIKQCEKVTIESVYDTLSEPRQKLVSPVVLNDEQYIAEWQEETYEKKGFHQDAPEYYTAKGERVRSKSEIFIADSLFRRNIPYRYEYPVILRTMTIHPDFTVLNVRKRKEYLWEHLGMMDDPEYSKFALERIRQYEKQGFYPGDKLIITHETNENPLPTRLIDDIISHYLL